VTGFRFRLYAADGDDLGAMTFSEPNWRVGDTVALADQVYRVRDVVYIDEDVGGLLEVRGMLMLEQRRRDDPPGWASRRDGVAADHDPFGSKMA
jgi:hypothetical protein